jgi:hypothetical protein
MKRYSINKIIFIKDDIVEVETKEGLRNKILLTDCYETITNFDDCLQHFSNNFSKVQFEKLEVNKILGFKNKLYLVDVQNIGKMKGTFSELKNSKNFINLLRKFSK